MKTELAYCPSCRTIKHYDIIDVPVVCEHCNTVFDPYDEEGSDNHGRCKRKKTKFKENQKDY